MDKKILRHIAILGLTLAGACTWSPTAQSFPLSVCESICKSETDKDAGKHLCGWCGAFRSRTWHPKKERCTDAASKIRAHPKEDCVRECHFGITSKDAKKICDEINEGS